MSSRSCWPLRSVLYICQSRSSNVQFYFSNHLVKSTHPHPTFTFTPAFLSYAPLTWPFFTSSPCSFPFPLLLLPSSLLLSVLTLPHSLNVPQGPQDFQQVTQTVHCLTSTFCFCLGRLGGGWLPGPQGRCVQSLEPDRFGAEQLVVKIGG